MRDPIGVDAVPRHEVLLGRVRALGGDRQVRRLGARVVGVTRDDRRRVQVVLHPQGDAVEDRLRDVRQAGAPGVELDLVARHLAARRRGSRGGGGRGLGLLLHRRPEPTAAGAGITTGGGGGGGQAAYVTPISPPSGDGEKPCLKSMSRFALSAPLTDSRCGRCRTARRSSGGSRAPGEVAAVVDRCGRARRSRGGSAGRGRSTPTPNRSRFATRMSSIMTARELVGDHSGDDSLRADDAPLPVRAARLDARRRPRRPGRRGSCSAPSGCARRARGRGGSRCRFGVDPVLRADLSLRGSSARNGPKNGDAVEGAAPPAAAALEVIRSAAREDLPVVGEPEAERSPRRPSGCRGGCRKSVSAKARSPAMSCSFQP